MLAHGHSHLSPSPFAQTRSGATRPSSPGLLNALYVAAVLLAPTIAVAGVVLLVLGRSTAGWICLLGAIAYRAAASTAVLLWDRLAERRAPRSRF